MPAFAAAYGIGERGCERRAAADDIVIMTPDLRAFIPGKNDLIVRKVAVRLAFTDACQPSSEMASSGPGFVRLPPALVTRMSTGPNDFSISARIASMSAKFVTSPVVWMIRG